MFLTLQPKVQLANMTFAILLNLIRKVTEAEEYVKKGLWKSCLIVPHIGSTTVECQISRPKTAAENLIGFFDDQQ
jgi:lactate dehydrogenase-like 2-hydroxyacid dehydrogenase